MNRNGATALLRVQEFPILRSFNYAVGCLQIMIIMYPSVALNSWSTQWRNAVFAGNKIRLVFWIAGVWCCFGGDLRLNPVFLMRHEFLLRRTSVQCRLIWPLDVVQGPYWCVMILEWRYDFIFQHELYIRAFHVLTEFPPVSNCEGEHLL